MPCLPLCRHTCDNIYKLGTERGWYSLAQTSATSTYFFLSQELSPFHLGLLFGIFELQPQLLFSCALGHYHVNGVTETQPPQQRSWWQEATNDQRVEAHTRVHSGHRMAHTLVRTAQEFIMLLRMLCKDFSKFPFNMLAPQLTTGNQVSVSGTTARGATTLPEGQSLRHMYGNHGKKNANHSSAPGYKMNSMLHTKGLAGKGDKNFPDKMIISVSLSQLTQDVQFSVIRRSVTGKVAAAPWQEMKDPQNQTQMTRWELLTEDCKWQWLIMSKVPLKVWHVQDQICNFSRERGFGVMECAVSQIWLTHICVFVKAQRTVCHTESHCKWKTKIICTLYHKLANHK